MSAIGIWAGIVLKQGVAAGIAVFLVYWITIGSGSNNVVTQMNKSLNDHISEQRFYLFAICINTAKDDAGRALCQRPVSMDQKSETIR